MLISQTKQENIETAQGDNMKKYFSYLLLLSISIMFFSACSSSDDISGDNSTKEHYITDFMVRADAGNGQVTLEWLADPDATTYNIYYIEDNDNTYDSLHLPNYKTMKSGTKIEGLISAPYTVSGLTQGKEYWFSISGTNPSGESYLGRPSFVTPLGSNAVPPAAPAGVRAQSGNQSVTVTWIPVTASPAVTSYKLYCYWQEGISNLGVGQPVIINGQASNSIVVNSMTWEAGSDAGETTALQNGRTYYFYLTAVNANGESSHSFFHAAIPSDNPPPAAPANLIATNAASGLESGQIYLDWTEIAGATYNIYYGTAKNITKNSESLLASGGTEAGFLVSGLTRGKTYYFVVTAVNANGESAESNEVSMIPKE